MKKNKISKREIAYQKLHEAIICGELKPGEKITERIISETLKIGTTPIREAIRQLQSEGLVDVSTNKGAMVSRINVKDIEDAYDVASILEAYAVEKAALLITEPQMEEIRSFLNEMRKAGNLKDYRVYMEENRLFHSRFHQILGNVILSQQIENLRNRFTRFGVMLMSMHEFWENSLQAHYEILEFVFEGKSKKAGKCMGDHLQEIKKILSDFMRGNPWM